MGMLHAVPAGSLLVYEHEGAPAEQNVLPRRHGAGAHATDAMSSMTPSQSSSTPLQVSVCGGAGAALHTAFIPLQIQVPDTAQPPTPAVHAPAMRQNPPQLCWPAGHAHTPAVHTMPELSAPHAVPLGTGPISAHTGRSATHAVVRPSLHGTPVSHGPFTVHVKHEYGGPSARRAHCTGSTSTVGAPVATDGSITCDCSGRTTPDRSDASAVEASTERCAASFPQPTAKSAASSAAMDQTGESAIRSRRDRRFGKDRRSVPVSGRTGCDMRVIEQCLRGVRQPFKPKKRKMATNLTQRTCRAARASSHAIARRSPNAADSRLRNARHILAIVAEHAAAIADW